MSIIKYVEAYVVVMIKFVLLIILICSKLHVQFPIPPLRTHVLKGGFMKDCHTIYKISYILSVVVISL